MLLFSLIKKFLSRGRKKRKNPPILKILIGFISAILILVLTVVIIDDVVTENNNNRTNEIGDKQFYTVVNRSSGGGEINPGGNRGYGLNLLLMNNLTTESYVKEMLELYLDSSEGKLDSQPYHVAFETLLGIQYNETGYYPSTVLLKSFLPFDNGQVIWNKAYKGYPAELFKLRSFNSYGSSVGKSDWGNYWGPFQVSKSLISQKSNINGYNTNDSRTADIWYLPDHLVYVHSRVSGYFRNYFGISISGKGKDVKATDKDGTELTEEGTPSAELITIASPGTHNAGEAGFTYPVAAGVIYDGASNYVKGFRDNASEYVKNMNLVAKDLANITSVFNPYGNITAGGASRAVASYGLLEQGYYLDIEGLNYLTGGRYVTSSQLNTAASVVGLPSGQALKEYFQSKYKPVPFSNEDATRVYGMKSTTSFKTSSPFNSGTKGHIYIVREETSSIYKNKMSNGSAPPLVQYMYIETLGQMYDTLFSGPSVYARMLKYAGVGVDPTNPSEYINELGDEWTPSGETDWLREYGLDPTQMTKGQIKIFNEGKKWFGSWYAWGGNGPKKDDNGNWLQPQGTGRWTGGIEIKTGGWDCSGFTRTIFQDAFGVFIGYTTWDQIDYPGFTKIKQHELKPGDVILRNSNGSGHVAIYVGEQNGYFLVMDARQTGTQIGISPWRKLTNTKDLNFLRYEPMFDN